MHVVAMLKDRSTRSIELENDFQSWMSDLVLEPTPVFFIPRAVLESPREAELEAGAQIRDPVRFEKVEGTHWLYEEVV